MTPAELKTKRNAMGLSQQSLADWLGVNRVTIARWEIGTRDIPPFLHLALQALDNPAGDHC